MDFIDNFVADFTPEELACLSKKQLLRIAIVQRNEQGILNILSDNDPNVIIRESDLTYTMESRVSNYVKVAMIMYEHHESEPYIYSISLIEFITSTQNTDLYDKYYDDKLNNQRNIDMLFIKNISNPKVFSHLMIKNRIANYDTLCNVGMSVKDKAILSKCGLMNLDYDDLWQNDKPKVPINNLFMRYCADGRLDDVKAIMKKMKHKSRQLN